MVAKFCKTIIKKKKSNKNGQKQKNIKNHLPIINYIIIFAQKNTHIGMNTTDQTTQQIERTIKKIAQKFHNSEDTSALTDIHLRVSQDSGELLAFDDENNEITRCVIEQWIDNKDEDFYDSVTVILRNILNKNHDIIDNLGILKPFGFVLEDDDNENIAELYLADDDTIIIGDDLMQDMDNDLDTFLDNLLKEN